MRHFADIRSLDRDWLFVSGPGAYAQELIQRAAAMHGVAVDDIKGPSRLAKHFVPRQHAMWLLRQYTTASLPRIGQLLGGRDHATVIHGIAAHERRRKAGHADAHHS